MTWRPHVIYSYIGVVASLAQKSSLEVCPPIILKVSVFLQSCCWDIWSILIDHLYFFFKEIETFLFFSTWKLIKYMLLFDVLKFHGDACWWWCVFISCVERSLRGLFFFWRPVFWGNFSFISLVFLSPLFSWNSCYSDVRILGLDYKLDIFSLYFSSLYWTVHFCIIFSFFKSSFVLRLASHFLKICNIRFCPWSWIQYLPGDSNNIFEIFFPSTHGFCLFQVVCLNVDFGLLS